MGGKLTDTPVTYAIVAKGGVLVETVAQPSALRPAIPMRSDDAIVIRGLTKVFHPIELRLRSLHPLRRRPPISALQDLTLTVRCSEVLGLLGTNGAGKTTLLKILATLVLPNAGDRKSTRLNSSHTVISYAVFCLKKKKKNKTYIKKNKAIYIIITR